MDAVPTSQHFLSFDSSGCCKEMEWPMILLSNEGHRRNLSRSRKGGERKGKKKKGRKKTYGKQRGVHRHRRNRPCTYPNCRREVSKNVLHLEGRVSDDVVFDWGVGGEQDITAAGRCGGRQIGTTAGESVVRDIPIVDNEGSNFLCDGADALVSWTLGLQVSRGPEGGWRSS